MIPLHLYWLPVEPKFDAALRAIRSSEGDFSEIFTRLKHLANTRLNFVQTMKLDRILQRTLRDCGECDVVPRIRLALLASSTIEHVLPSIRVAGLRRGLVVDCYVAPYGQYWQQVIDSKSDFHKFNPDVVFLSLDAQTATTDLSLTADSQAVTDTINNWIESIRKIWARIHQDLNSVVVQQTFLDLTLPLFGGFDLHVPASPTSLVRHFNRALFDAAASDGVLLIRTESADESLVTVATDAEREGKPIFYLVDSEAADGGAWAEAGAYPVADPTRLDQIFDYL